MKKFAVLLFTVLLGLGMACTPDAFAAPGNGKGNPAKPGKGNTQVRVRMNLIPSDAAQTDLAAASGKVDFRTKNGKSHFKSSISIPLVSSTLAIADDATAAAADIHIEFKRSDVVVGDCKLALVVPDSDELAAEPATDRDLRLNLQKAAKRKPVHAVKGSCGGVLPMLQLGDSALVYANVAGVRVDFMKNSQ